MGAPSAAVIDAQGNKYENTLHTLMDLSDLEETYGYVGSPYIISTLMWINILTLVNTLD